MYKSNLSQTLHTSTISPVPTSKETRPKLRRTHSSRPKTPGVPSLRTDGRRSDHRVDREWVARRARTKVCLRTVHTPKYPS